ncbi:MAG: L-threonylcarbamoyladenylate synthase [Candidatus Nanohaloarchaeota archaeon QJJ-7]|nr:L-threonylcarbamoyladenylate synthase [Candidatus Nanohaloarchaeota archaeon QJJ-7]
MAVKPVSEESIREAAEVIRSGGTVIYPTETCYGVGCDATDEEAIEKIYDMKQRPEEKGLTVIVDSLETADEYSYLTPDDRKLVEEFMPGPLTLVTEKRRNVPDLLNSEFAFRIPGNETSRMIAEETGIPVVATSANVSGEPSKYSIEGIDDSMLGSVDLVLDDGELDDTPSSTVIRLTGEGLKVYREGPVSRESIEEVV